MSNSRKIPAILSAALAFGGFATALYSGRALLQWRKLLRPRLRPARASSGSIAVSEVPFYAEWAVSPHAHKTSEPFTYWDKQGTIPVACSGCHSTPGFLDLLGADGSTAGVVDRPAPVGTVITCIACHNSTTRALTSVTFPSGAKVDNLGANARCMTCHQGRTSTNTVANAVTGQDDDAVNTRLTFVNIHYRAAAATLYGSIAHGGYEYSGKTYAERFQHVESHNRCIACHEAHSTAVRATDCGACHKQAADGKSLRDIRIRTIDYDGNGNADEGIAQEIENLRNRLHSAIVTYARTVVKKDIVYDFLT